MGQPWPHTSVGSSAEILREQHTPRKARRGYERKSSSLQSDSGRAKSLRTTLEDPPQGLPGHRDTRRQSTPAFQSLCGGSWVRLAPSELLLSRQEQLLLPYYRPLPWLALGESCLVLAKRASYRPPIPDKGAVPLVLSPTRGSPRAATVSPANPVPSPTSLSLVPASHRQLCEPSASSRVAPVSCANP